jgi:HD-like signal output (HDOD) protein
MLAADLPSYAYERAAEKLSAGPRVFAQLVELMLDPRTELSKVADLLKRDAVLSAKILRVANSAAIGGRASGSIADLSEALQRVGLSEVYRVVGIAVTLQSANSALSSYGIGCQRLRENALFEALSAEALARAVEMEHRTAYAFGLMRNYGRMLLDRVVQLYRPHSGCFTESVFDSLVAWERDNFRTTGAQAGADLMMKWNFPDCLVRAVRQAAAAPETRHKDRGACLLHYAAWMASQADVGLPGEREEWEDTPDGREVLGLDDSVLKRVREEVDANFARLRSLME